MLGEVYITSSDIGDKKYDIVKAGDIYCVKSKDKCLINVYSDGGYEYGSFGVRGDLISSLEHLLVCLLNSGNEEKLVEYSVFGGVVLSCYTAEDLVRAKLSDGEKYVVIGIDRRIIINKGMDNAHISFLLNEMDKLDSAIRAYGSLHKQVTRLYRKL